MVIEGNWTTYRVYNTSSFPIILFEFHRCLSILEFLDALFLSCQGGLKVTVGAPLFHQLRCHFACICSPRYCITCDKWPLLPLMLNFYLSLYLMPLSMLSLLLSLLLNLHRSKHTILLTCI